MITDKEGRHIYKKVSDINKQKRATYYRDEGDIQTDEHDILSDKVTGIQTEVTCLHTEVDDKFTVTLTHRDNQGR